nr:hypothetical protein Itr_chr02CG05890 [Ipomoea trifida]
MPMICDYTTPLTIDFKKFIPRKSLKAFCNQRTVIFSRSTSLRSLKKSCKSLLCANGQATAPSVVSIRGKLSRTRMEAVMAKRLSVGGSNAWQQRQLKQLTTIMGKSSGLQFLRACGILSSLSSHLDPCLLRPEAGLWSLVSPCAARHISIV